MGSSCTSRDGDAREEEASPLPLSGAMGVTIAVWLLLPSPAIEMNLILSDGEGESVGDNISVLFRMGRHGFAEACSSSSRPMLRR